MAKKVKLYMSIDPDTRKKLDELKILENRSSLNNMIDHILTTYCRNNEHKLRKNR